MTEEDPDYFITLEKAVVEATAAAFRRALSLGSPVLIAKDGELRSIYPDGTSRFIKRLPQRAKMVKGTIIRIDH